MSNRQEVTNKIKARKVLWGLQWKDVAELIGQSPAWTIAACLGQATCSPEQAQKVGQVFELTVDEMKWLQTVPNRDGIQSIPTDPLLYRFHEALGVYGPALKEMIQEEFGDGIMSAIDFSVQMERESNAAGDRVKLIWSGKFLPYKPF